MKPNWNALKSQLVSEGLLDKFFAEPLDQKLNQPDPRFVIPTDAYFPLLIETHLRDVSSHLDRALSYRREIRELEILAVKAGVEFILQRDQAKDELDLSIIRLRKFQNTMDKEAQQKAVAAFAGTTEVGAGFREVATGAVARLTRDIGDADDESKLLTQMYKRSRDYCDRYWQRHNEPGNAHNFSERADRLLQLLRQDINFAEHKCHAFNLGFQAIYGRWPQTPLTSESIASLDALVMWVRDLFEEIAIEDELESEFDIVLPFVQPLKVGKSLVPAATWKAAFDKAANGKLFDLNFELKEEYFLGRKNLRVKRVGLTYGTKLYMESSGIDSKATFESYCRYRGELTPPPQPVGRVSYRRPPITLGGISIYGGPVAYADSSECSNLNPIGMWRILLQPNPTTKDIKNVNLSTGIDESTGWLDLKLHLRLRAKGGGVLSNA